MIGLFALDLAQVRLKRLGRYPEKELNNVEQTVDYRRKWYVMTAVAMGIFAPIAGVMSDRFGTRPMTVLGLIMLLLGYAALTSLSTEASTWGYILRLIPIGIGWVSFNRPITAPLWARSHASG